MKSKDIQLGKPNTLYTNTKANIEALPNPVEGMEAWATDTNESGHYDGTNWVWGGTGTDANAIHDNVAGEINALTEIFTPQADDALLIEDSILGAYSKKKLLASALFSKRSGEYLSLSQVTADDTDMILLEDDSDDGSKKKTSVSSLRSFLNIQEADGTPSVNNVKTIKVSNGTLTDNTGGVVTITTGGGTDADAIHDNVSGEIVAVTEKTSPVGADRLLIEDSEATNAKKSVKIENLPGWVYLSTPLTSTSWDGDARSTTAKTLIDLSVVFGVPAGVKAIFAVVIIRDSASAANDCYLTLSPENATAGDGVHFDCSGLADDKFERGNGIIPCNADGDIYYKIGASGAGTLDAYLQIWGYLPSGAVGGGGGSLSVATDAIFDAKGDLPVGTGANTAARLAVGSNGQILVADSAQTTGIKWANPSVTYLLDTPPGSPHSKDDEFSGTSLDAKWTNPATSTRTLTLAVSNGLVTLEPSETGTASTGSRGGFGIRQAAPTGSFTIMAKIINTGHVGDEARVGIFVARTADNKGHILGNLRGLPRIVNADGFTYSESADWGAYDGFDSYVAPDWPIVVWMKIVWDSSAGSLAFYYSADGWFWTLLTTRTGQSQPDRIGIAMWANTANIYADHVLACDWFRVTEP